MMFVLDTNVCIQLLNQAHVGIINQFRQVLPGEIAICSIVKAELIYGARRSQTVESNLKLLKAFFDPLASLPFNDRCAEEAGLIRADLAVQRKPIGPNDLLIAAIARAHDGILVTHNTREYARVTGLRLEDWELAAS